jgi:alpha-1,2-mannosyltransferase
MPSLLDGLAMPRALRARVARALAVALTTVGTLLHLSWGQLTLGPYKLDLTVYRVGARVWMSGGDLYGGLMHTRDGISLPFTYPPVAAVAMSPLALVPWWVASLAITLGSLCALALVVARFVRSAGHELGPLPRRAAALLGWALPLAFLAEPVRSTLGYGQVNILLMALVTVDCLAAPRRGRGALVGLAAAVKLTPAAFLLYFVVQGDWRAARTCVLTFLGATAAGFVLAGADSTAYWGSVVFQTSRPGSPHYAGNQSMYAVLSRLGVGGVPLALVWVVLSVAVVLVAANGMRQALLERRPAWALALNGFTALLVSPISWSHHWVWAVPGVLLVAWRGGATRRLGWLVLGAVGLAVFWTGPMWFLPVGGDRELGWSWWQQVVGGVYIWYALATVVASSVVGRVLVRTVRGRLDLERRVVDVEMVAHAGSEPVQHTVGAASRPRRGVVDDHVRRQYGHAAGDRPHVKVVNVGHAGDRHEVPAQVVEVHPGRRPLEQHVQRLPEQRDRARQDEDRDGERGNGVRPVPTGDGDDDRCHADCGRADHVAEHFQVGASQVEAVALPFAQQAGRHDAGGHGHQPEDQHR